MSILSVIDIFQVSFSFVHFTTKICFCNRFIYLFVYVFCFIYSTTKWQDSYACKVYGLIYDANGIKFYFVFLALVLNALTRILLSFLDAKELMNTY